MADIPPLARNSDEFTSHIAADEHVKSGSWAASKFLVLNAARKRDRLESYTAREFSRDTGIKHEIVHKRFPDLEKVGLMFKVDHRRCEVTGKKAILWSAFRPPEREVPQKRLDKPPAEPVQLELVIK